jgi:DNA recombination protein RmuC
MTIYYIALFFMAAVLIAAAYLIIKINSNSKLQESIITTVKEQNVYLSQSMDKITEKLMDTALENQKQIEKNNELFSKIQTSQFELKTYTQNSLSEFNLELNRQLAERFDAITKSLNDRLDTVSQKIDKRLGDSIDKITLSFEKQKEQSKRDFDEFINKVEIRLDRISNKVDERLKEGFENVDKTFKDIIEGIARISEAQKKIEQLSGEVVSLQNVLSDKKTRGIFGELQLENILKSVFGDNKELYDLQYTFAKDGTSKVIADAVIKAPQIGIIAIDSKFPLENYTKMTEVEGNEKTKYTSLFTQNLKKHINDISEKYIIRGKTADMAILFLPAEAIFAQINAYHQNIIDYAFQKHVWIASPTTLMALLTTIQAVVRDIKTQKQAKKIQEELIKLSKNFSLYKERWEKFIKEIERVNQTAKQINTTTDKIANAFERIEKVEFKQEEDKTDTLSI